MEKGLVKDYTKGPIVKQLVAFFIPLFLANVLQIIYNIADMIIVGQVVGSTGLSAVSIGGDVSHLITFLVMGFAGAAQIIISQLIGSDQKNKIGPFIGTFISFTAICVVVLTVLCILLRNPIVTWMQTPEAAKADTLSYFVTCSVGLVFIFGYNAISSIMRGLGDSKRPFVFIAVAAVLNVGLDLLFVLVIGMGTFGAALATVISQGVSFLLGIGYMWFKRNALGFEMHVKYIRLNRIFLKPLLKLGLPMALKQAAISISKLFVNSFLNSYGLAVSAVVGIVGKIGNISILVSDAFNTAGSSMIGQNMGAAKYDRVLKVMASILVLVLPIYAVLTAVMLLFPEAVYSIFSTDPEVIAIAMQYLPIWVLTFVSFAFRAPMNAFINGSGNYGLNFAVAILDAIVFRVGLCVLFGIVLDYGYMGFWYGDALAGFVPILIGLIYLPTGKWKKQKAMIE